MTVFSFGIVCSRLSRIGLYLQKFCTSLISFTCDFFHLLGNKSFMFLQLSLLAGPLSLESLPNNFFQFEDGLF